eukprot:COSAG01_NODE_68119_length_265_cov_0.614458_1_plen_69_part_10
MGWGGARPFAASKPPTNPAVRHRACGIGEGEVLKCFLLAVVDGADGGTRALKQPPGGGVRAAEQQQPAA